MTLSPPNSRWSSLVFFFVFLHLSHASLFSLSKKTSSRFLLFYFLFCIPCIQFIANLSVNSLQILVRSYLSKWAEVTSVFLCVNSVSLTCNFRSNRILSVPPKHSTRFHRLRNRKNNLPLVLYFFWSSSTQWILSSTSITFTLVLYAVTQGPNPSAVTQKSRRTLLGNWCQRGREISHQSLLTSKGERS